ncbi:CDP-alcohol phosphatidyltransferase family protein [Kocuria sp. cx-116]|nr:CDP-alcohol phosphatidyltransferase family protein [Kocuria sp. cx-116]
MPLMRITHQLPNLFTTVRLVATVPLVRRIRTGRTGVGTAVGVAAWAATDWVDGRLARRMQWESVIGRALDPIADRAGIAVIAWSLATAGELPRRVPSTVLTVDIATSLLTTQAASRGLLRVSYLGKVRSTILFVALVVAAAGPKKRRRLGRIPHALADLGAVLHVVAGVRYIRAARPLRGTYA